MKVTVRTGLKLMLPVLVSLMVSPVVADETGDNFVREIRIGALAHDVDNLWSGFSREGGADINIEAVFTPSWGIAGGAVRPALGGSFNTSGDTSKIYLDARWEYGEEEGIFFGFGVGAAVHNGEKHLVNTNTKALGSKVLFHIPLEIGYRLDTHHGISVYFDHVSNAYTQDENEGMDTLGVRYGYKF